MIVSTNTPTLSHSEIFTIILSMFSIIIASSIFYVINKQVKNQISANSAHLILKLQNTLNGKEYQNIKSMIKLANSKNRTPNDLKIFDPYLEQFENIAIFNYTKTLQFKQVAEFFGADIIELNNDSIMKHIVTMNKIDDFHYSHLVKLILDVEKYLNNKNRLIHLPHDV